VYERKTLVICLFTYSKSIKVEDESENIGDATKACGVPLNILHMCAVYVCSVYTYNYLLYYSICTLIDNKIFSSNFRAKLQFSVLSPFSLKYSTDSFPRSLLRAICI
jgi:hypothetical protein